MTYAATAASGFLVFFVTTYVLAFYLRTASFPDSLSYLADDAPGHIPNAGLAFGVHFFGDFLGTWTQSRGLSPYTVAPVIYDSNYPPLVHVLIYPLTLLPYGTAVTLFMCVSASMMLVPAFLITALRPTSERVVLVVTGFALTAPFLATLDRGNIQAIVTGLLLISALALHRGQNRRAAVLIGICAGLKVYPILFALVFVKHRQWRDLATSLVTFVTCLVIPAFVLQGNPLTSLRLAWGMSGVFRGVGSVAATPLAFNNSLFSFLSAFTVAASDSVSSVAAFATAHYSAISGVTLMAIVLVVMLTREVTTTEIVIIMAAVMVTLPSTVGSYSLAVLFMPAAMIVLRRRRPESALLTYAVILGLLMVPKAIALPDGHGSLGTFLNPMLASTLIVVVLLASIRRSYHHRASDPTPGDHASG